MQNKHSQIQILNNPACVLPSDTRSNYRGDRFIFKDAWQGYTHVRSGVSQIRTRSDGFNQWAIDKDRKLSPMFNVVYRNVGGILNIIFLMLWRDHLSRYMVMPFNRIISSIITSHVILHIKRQAKKDHIVYLEDGELRVGGLSEFLNEDDGSIGPIQFRRSSLGSQDGEY
ncbi:hypothetical protein K435DRAFT_843984 [Dendrothele bispora CBS 962.96]|uniref:Uncharacterized protein n=1 Tax=Dendrothele bispora (strain CBS 962.96) TaxID=1314807 RepID=A0A4S8L5E1_DENBC|nr:hypothetical protein K435DRAFT_845394 [Dendrothele bispora CBS 962.96]THU83573.1 hypothetical protein K435DRAFT_843984 [Dendrothele bispora CBS 962.96]